MRALLERMMSESGPDIEESLGHVPVSAYDKVRKDFRPFGWSDPARVEGGILDVWRVAYKTKAAKWLKSQFPHINKELTFYTDYVSDIGGKKALVVGFRKNRDLGATGDAIAEITKWLKIHGYKFKKTGKKGSTSLFYLIDDLKKMAMSESDESDVYGMYEAVGKKDKSVIALFIDHTAGEGKKLSSNGRRLDGLWMGGRGIAQWNSKGRIEFQDLGSKAAARIQAMIVKMVPKSMLA